MTKDEALLKIEELKQYVEELDKKLTITSKCDLGSFGYDGNRAISVGDNWAYSQYKNEQQGDEYVGSKTSNHLALLFLTNLNGTWYDKNGNVISSYLFYKPNGE